MPRGGLTGAPIGRARWRPERLKALAQALQLFCATVFCINLLLRDHVPLPLSVVLAQSSVALAAYLCLLGAREYMGRAPLGHGVAALALALLLSTALFFTLVKPNCSTAARF